MDYHMTQVTFLRTTLTNVSKVRKLQKLLQ